MKYDVVKDVESKLCTKKYEYFAVDANDWWLIGNLAPKSLIATRFVVTLTTSHKWREDFDYCEEQCYVIPLFASIDTKWKDIKWKSQLNLDAVHQLPPLR